jgi:hypothetical protein
MRGFISSLLWDIRFDAEKFDMKHTKTKLTAILLLIALPLHSEILDRIVVVIDDSFIITLSDIRKERTIQTALGSNPGDDNAIVESLIERHLVEEQIAQFLEIDIPQDLIEERLRAIGNPAGISSQDLKEAVVGDYRRRQFMIERFQQFIRVSDDELQRYYEDVFVPAVRQRGERVPPLGEVVEGIRQNKVLEKMNEEVTVWLKELRGRSTIEKINN